MPNSDAYDALMKFYPLTLDDLEGEEWRDIGGYKNCQVSSFGRVKSFQRKRPRILKPRFFHWSNYLCVRIWNGNGRDYQSIHRLVATTFISNPENKSDVNHRDGNKFNNHVSNLEWLTHKENLQHAVATGLHLSGGDRHDAKLTNEQVAYIRSLFKPYDKNFGAKALSRTFGVSDTTICRIVHGKTYKKALGTKHKSKSKRVPNDARNEIRRLYQKGKRGCGEHTLAKQFGIGVATVHSIIHEEAD